MSHEEIWDDSALINSWDAAVSEYKKYHSIAARGEKVEDVLRAHESASAEESRANGVVEAEEGEFEEGGDGEDVVPGSETLVKEDEPVLEPSLSNPLQPAAETALPVTAPPLPPHLVGSVRDEGMKNLLMSWYYAGYYTGLYKGQQQAAGAAAPAAEGGQGAAEEEK